MAQSPQPTQPATTTLPSYPLKFGGFEARFDPGGTYTLQGKDWPALNGTWTSTGNEVALSMSGGPGGCDGPGRYQFRMNGKHLSLVLVSDDCKVRQMILSQSDWWPNDEARVIPTRSITRTAGARAPSGVTSNSSKGNWPSFRGPQASGVSEGQNLPEKWNGKTGENVLWRTPIPGLAHSSPVVWGNRIFVTSAVSSDPKASFRPGLYGDGDASKDRSQHRWMLYAIDKGSGKIVWEQTAHVGEPLEKRHIKSTYANSTPATDGRIVVTWFGSQGIHAYDFKGRFLWKVDLGRVDMGAYDIPTIEWGPASSPIIWNDLVIVQCDTQTDSFCWRSRPQPARQFGKPIAMNCRRGERLPWCRPHPGRNWLPMLQTSSGLTIHAPEKSCGGSGAVQRSRLRHPSLPTT